MIEHYWDVWGVCSWFSSFHLQIYLIVVYFIYKFDGYFTLHSRIFHFYHGRQHYGGRKLSSARENPYSFLSCFEPIEETSGSLPCDCRIMPYWYWRTFHLCHGNHFFICRKPFSGFIPFNLISEESLKYPETTFNFNTWNQPICFSSVDTIINSNIAQLMSKKVTT